MVSSASLEMARETHSEGEGSHDAAPVASRAGGQWWLVAVLTVLSGLAMIDKYIFALLVNPIKAYFHFSDVQISVLLGAAFAIANLSVAVPAGYLADRFSRRSLIAAGVLLWSICASASGLATSYAQLFIARALVGVGEGTIPPPSFSLLRDGVAQQRRGLALSIYSIANMAGTAAALLLGGALVGFFAASGIHTLPIVGAVQPWQLTLLAVGALGLPLALLIYTVRDPGRGPPSTATDTSAAELTFTEAWRHVSQHLGIYAPLAVFVVASAMISQSFGAWMPAMLGRTWGLTPQAVGARLGLLMLTMAPLGLLCAGFALDRLARRGYVGAGIVGIVGTAVVWLAGSSLPFITTQSVLWPVIAILMFASGVFMPIAPLMVGLAAPPRLTGKVMGLLLLAQGICAAAFAPTVVALVADKVFGGGRHALADALGSVMTVSGATAIVAMVVLIMRQAK